MAKNLPYVTTVSTLETMLEKIIAASVPERFTQDFVSTKLSMKGGTARAIIPFIKKMGFVASDGTPTELYKEFRNHTKSGAAVAKALKNVYGELYEMNEYAHDLKDSDLLGLIVEATGAEKSSAVVQKTLATFKTLKKLADFEIDLEEKEPVQEINPEIPPTQNIPIQTHLHQPPASTGEGINLSYTINLNLPATTDIEVFNAIFKSLKDHLLQK
jgi:hypothetical protein